MKISAKAYYLLAETYTKKARFLEAMLNAQKAVKHKPFRNSCAHFLMSNLYSISSYRSFKNSLKAKWEFVLSVLTLPFDLQALENVGRTLSYLKFFPILAKGFYMVHTKGVDTAIDIYIKAIEKAQDLCRFIVFWATFTEVSEDLTMQLPNTKWQSGLIV